MPDALSCYHALVAALKAGDEPATRELIADDFVIHEDEGMPYGGTYHGVDGFLEMVSKVWEAWGGAHFEPLYQIAEPDRVCAIVHLEGAPGSRGEGSSTQVNEVWHFRDGKAVEARVWYYDTPRLRRALEGRR